MRRVPSIPTSALRDHGGSERIDRIWKRLQPDLLGGPSGLPRPSPSVWIPAALAATFALGIFVGAKWVRPEHPTSYTPERQLAPGEPAARTAPAAERATAPSAQPQTPQVRKNRALGPAEPAELVFAPPDVLPPVMQPSPVGPPEWEKLADDDRYDEARAALDAHGGFSSVLGSASATQLLTLADIARRTGSRDQAILAWRRIVEAFPAAAEAPIAAWTLGRQLEDLGDSRGAAEAYELYRRLSPSGDFAEDALARQVDSAIEKGNLEELTRLVTQYENGFPNGSRLEEFRAELQKRSAGTPASEPDEASGSVPSGHAKDAVPPETPKTPSK
jgi:TolA-binding protein